MLSAYDISIIATIILTTLVAFYLLYSAKELNLGIVIAISFGAITLGILFNPTFKMLLDFLSHSMNFGRKFALVLALVIILIIFLVAVLVLSLILSLLIPKKFLNIDLGKYIDRFISLLTTFFKKTAKSIGDLKYKFKKPVDTTEIIDKMGIDMDNQQVSSVDMSTEMKDNVLNPLALDLAADEATLMDNVETAHNESEQHIELDMTQLIAAIEKAEKQSELDISDLEAEVEEDEQQTELEMAELIAAIEKAGDQVEFESTELEAAIEESEQQVEPEAAELEAAVEESEQQVELEAVELEVAIEDVEQQVELEAVELEVAIEDVEQQVELEATELEAAIIEAESASTANNIDLKQLDLNSCVLRAMEYKDAGRKSEAIEYYMAALEKAPKREMVFWIVLDICTLYKQLGLSILAQSILEGLASEFGDAIAPEVRAEIMNNLK